MAEPLKSMFGPEMVHRAAVALATVDSDFDIDAFTEQALDGFDELELTPRARQIADAMADHLPDDRHRAIDIVVDSFGPELENCDPDDVVSTEDPAADDNSIGGFYYMSYGFFIADRGNDHFDQAMRANYELTKRFTAEFSVRPFIEANTDGAMALLAEWATDENVHVRRLVSEGTRPRLPWASQLKMFVVDPTPILSLLETLKDDPVEYVRRSVANNLNDIAKDHPQLVVDITKRWWADGDRNRRRLVRHALRTLIKAGDAGALDVLGYAPNSPIRVAGVAIDPGEVTIGEKVSIEVTLENPASAAAAALVDLAIHFVKANGSTSAKVFKGAEVEIEPGADVVVRKKVSVAQHSTRTHHPGEHAVDVLINGRTDRVGSFELTT
ncbi:MAG: DNA alkylation repair protein [Acidimicrobiales bacterium]